MQRDKIAMSEQITGDTLVMKPCFVCGILVTTYADEPAAWCSEDCLDDTYPDRDVRY